VLVRYPLGDANRLLKDKLQRERQDKDDEKGAIDELEKEIKQRQKSSETPVVDKQSAAPVPEKVSSAPEIESRDLSLAEIRAVEKQHNLADLSNMDARQRRAQALLKPNAFVEHITLR
jgi:hypothetical protein